ncbi:MAG: hypothetical protein J0M15_00190 [Deltaproteobacteria bacterium]|jgi:hypothetical protein|nr:hypothetical protein [Deltaproteobacteria bacterium]
MSNLLTSKKILIFFSFFSFGFFTTYFFQSYFAKNPNFADHKISEIEFKSKLGKSLSFVNVQMEIINLARNNSDITEIKAYITLLKSSNNLASYWWTLPEGVTLVEGDIEGLLQNVEPETPQELSLKVSGFSKSEKKLISLSASTLIGDNSFSNVGLISSKPEDSYEFIANKNFQGNLLQQMDLSSKSLKHFDENKIYR